MSETIRKQELNKSLHFKLTIRCAGSCGGTTLHDIVASVDCTDSLDHPYHYFEAYERHQIVKCRGCEAISFRKVSGNSENTDHDGNGNEYWVELEELFPQRAKGSTWIGDDIYFIPTEMHEIYRETLSALSSNSPILAGVGLRALLEAICRDRGASGRDLRDKINTLEKEGVLTPVGSQILHQIRALGNRAAHEVKPHTESQLYIAMEVIENLLRDIYILPKKFQSEFEEEVE